MKKIKNKQSSDQFNELFEDWILALLTNTQSKSDDEDVDDDMNTFNHLNITYNFTNQ